MSSLYPFQPSTNSAVDAIVEYLTAATFPGSTTPVYNACSKGEFKDLTDLIGNGKGCCEVYGNLDDSQRHLMGGVVRDTPTFYILSIADMTNASNAETLIYSIRDAIVPLFVANHVQLGSVPGILVVAYKQGSGRYTRMFRNGQWYRSHVFELAITSSWIAQTGFQP